MPWGSLYTLLHEGTGVVVDSAQALRFAVDVARGMAFLHSLERIIPQYYLNSRHVMVSLFFTITHAFCNFILLLIVYCHLKLGD